MLCVKVNNSEHSKMVLFKKKQTNRKQLTVSVLITMTRWPQSVDTGVNITASVCNWCGFMMGCPSWDPRHKGGALDFPPCGRVCFWKKRPRLASVLPQCFFFLWSATIINCLQYCVTFMSVCKCIWCLSEARFVLKRSMLLLIQLTKLCLSSSSKISTVTL